MIDQTDDLLRRAEDMESTLRQLHQDGAARTIRELRLELASSRKRANGIARAACALVDDARRHARQRSVADDDMDVDDDLWRGLVTAVDASRAVHNEGSEDAA